MTALARHNWQPAGHSAAAIRPLGHLSARRARRRQQTALCSAAAPEPTVEAAAGRVTGGSLWGDSSGNSRSGHSFCNGTGSSAVASSSQVAPASSAAAAAGCRIRPCENADYWGVADLHCSAFYPRATPFWFAALRLDRVMALQIGQERQDLGHFLCLVADSPAGPAMGGGQPAAATAASGPAAGGAPPAGRLKTACGPGALWEGERVDLGPLVDALVALFFPPAMRLNYATTYSAAALRGAVVVDTQGEHVPRKRREMPNGTVREVRRAGIAYLSNLAVAPCQRRSGIGRQLLREAEAAAAAWGCRTMALHVDPCNTAAMQMYRNAGYRAVLHQPEWQRWLEGRQKALVLMMRALPRRAPAPAPGAAEPTAPAEQPQPHGATA